MIIKITDDFNLRKIAYSGQCFRVKELDENTFSFITKASRVTMKYISDGTYDVTCDQDEWDGIWRDYFDLDTIYSDIRASIPDNDTYMKNAAEIGKGIRILKQDYFEMLISFIISQRKSIPAIKTSVERLCTLYGKNGFFPTPESMLNATNEELSSCGLGYRVAYVSEAAKKVALHEVDLNELSLLSDDDLFTELKSFNGIGDKVANCVALFGYHRVGRAPVDTWIKKVIDNSYNGINPFPTYGSVAGIMQQYMFYAAQQHKTI